jgi:hypothetical protein
MRSKPMMAVMLLATCALAGSIGLGQTSSSSGPPDKVEEDWQLVIASPNPDESGPQMTTCMSPVSDGSTPFIAFDLNYRDYPSFQAGGLEVKVYANGNVTDFVMDSSSQGNNLLRTTNETITWTQQMSLTADNTVRYTIINGQSTTWGPFGALAGLDPVIFNTSITSLASYSPDTSVAKSGAGWQSNRVSQMTLVRVRYYRAGQLISTDNNPRPVSLSVADGQ